LINQAAISQTILFYSQKQVVAIENIASFWIIDLGRQHQERENVDKIVLLRVASPPPFFLPRNKKLSAVAIILT
jgi:hypothetical protein